MNTADEVMVDEVRLPRMFRKMRSAGLYRRCGCAGCAPCVDSARQLLRGIAASAQSVRPYRPERWGNRYRMFSRLLGPRMVDVLADVSAAPTIVDVNVHPAPDSEPPDDAPEPADADAGGEGELPLATLLARRIPADLTARGSTRPLRDLVASAGIPGVPAISFAPPLGMAALTAAGGLARLPTGPGLYLVQWNSGQYLGIARSLRSRIAQHVDSLQRLVRNPSHYRFHVAAVGGDPRAVEKQVLTALANLVGSERDPVASRLARLGLTNRQREIGLP